jgi:rhodanese-related sulfurtransferase
MRCPAKSGKNSEVSCHVNQTENHGQLAPILLISDTLGGMSTADIFSHAPGVIDVRTVEEFADGHVTGAVNLDLENGAFLAELADLDKNVGYALYCRSGRRSAIAAELMATAGFTEVHNLGALESAAQTLGLPIVTQ